MKSSIWVSLLVAGSAFGQIRVENVCDTYRFCTHSSIAPECSKVRPAKGDLYVLCPRKECSFTIRGICSGASVRAFYKGRDVALTCGTENPFLSPVPPDDTFKLPRSCNFR